MKNLSSIVAVMMVAGLAACTTTETNEAPNYRYAGRKTGCSDTLIKERPAQSPVCNSCQARRVARPAPVAAPACGGCQAREYTVRTPVQVVYKNTTYHTVYEPRTWETSSFETRPYNRAEACTSGNCGGQAVVSSQPVMSSQPVATQQQIVTETTTSQPVVMQPAAVNTQAPAYQQYDEVYEK